ncbi:hypothetical protein V6Z05_15420 [Leptospira venezuelensis]|uniref:hypothetical protein n=1 Tax=Leptospira venezuelensis TaxID=1958811 RepID=UPI000A3B7F1D|nr:hypothetical protein [Leptospira venezuelensis]
MLNRLFIPLLFAFFIQSCITEKTCSDKDRSCSTEGLILSLFTAPEGIYIYSTITSYQGNLSILGAGALDASLQQICSRDRLLASIIDFKCQSVAPLVSTTLVPANNLNSLYSTIPYNGVSVRGPNGTLVSQEMSTLFAYDLKASLTSAGIEGGRYWSFSDGNGNYGASCSDGTDNSSTIGSVLDPTIVTQSNWFASQSPTCSQYHKVLCICYVPSSSSGGGG